MATCTIRGDVCIMCTYTVLRLREIGYTAWKKALPALHRLVRFRHDLRTGTDMIDVQL